MASGSASLVIMEKQIKTTKRYHYVSIRVAKIEKDQPYQVLMMWESAEFTHTADGSVKL